MKDRLRAHGRRVPAQELELDVDVGVRAQHRSPHDLHRSFAAFGVGAGVGEGGFVPQGGDGAAGVGLDEGVGCAGGVDGAGEMVVGVVGWGRLGRGGGRDGEGGGGFLKGEEEGEGREEAEEGAHVCWVGGMLRLCNGERNRA